MKHSSSWTLLALTALVIAGGSVAACNTVEGAGQDIQAGGKAIERTAQDVKK